MEMKLGRKGIENVSTYCCNVTEFLFLIYKSLLKPCKICLMFCYHNKREYSYRQKIYGNNMRFIIDISPFLLCL